MASDDRVQRLAPIPLMALAFCVALSSCGAQQVITGPHAQQVITRPHRLEHVAQASPAAVPVAPAEAPAVARAPVPVPAPVPAATPPRVLPPPPRALPPPAARPAGDYHRTLLQELLNHDRQVHGLAADPRSSCGGLIAALHAGQMAASGVLYHSQTPVGGCLEIAENVAGPFPCDGNTLNRPCSQPLSWDVGAEIGFMASPHHRANILNPTLTAVGTAWATDRLGNLWVAQDWSN